VVKGLAKDENRLRHVLRDKCVDASLFGEERLLPNDGSDLNSDPSNCCWKKHQAGFFFTQGACPSSLARNSTMALTFGSTNLRLG